VGANASVAPVLNAWIKVAPTARVMERVAKDTKPVCNTNIPLSLILKGTKHALAAGQCANIRYSMRANCNQCKVAFYYRVRKARAQIGAAEGLVELAKNVEVGKSLFHFPSPSPTPLMPNTFFLAGNYEALQKGTEIGKKGSSPNGKFHSISSSSAVKRPRQRSSKLKNALKDVEEAGNPESLTNAVWSTKCEGESESESDSSLVSSDSCRNNVDGNFEKDDLISAFEDVAKGLIQLASSIRGWESHEKQAKRLKMSHNILECH
jgi:hypothetical protein